MTARPIFLCLCLGLTLRGTAFAAKNVEVIQRPSLLMFGPVTQRVGVTYSLSDHASSRSEGASRSHALGETYSLSTIAAVVDPEYVIINLDVGGSYRQAWASEHSTFLNSQYNIVTSALRMSTNPITISDSRNTSLISNGFTPAYTLTRTSDQVSVSLLHEFLPVQFSYGHGSSQSSGLAQDYTTKSDALALSVTHEIPGRSQSYLTLNQSSEKSTGHDSRFYSLILNNGVFLDSRKRYNLHTGLRQNESKALEAPQKTFGFSESLSAQFGAALKGSLGYEYSSSSTVDFLGAPQQTQSRTVTGSLSHRLYKSLSTGISGSYGATNAYGGESTTSGGNAMVAYYKILPAQSSLMLSANSSRKITEQKLLVSTIDVPEEPHRVTAQGELITLAVEGELLRVAAVRSLNPDRTYLEGTDYRVDAEDRIEIMVGGGIAPGTDLLISYAVATNPDIKYLTTSSQAGYVVTLLGGRYTLGGGVSVMKEKLLSGADADAPLAKSTTVTLRADRRVGTTSMGVDYLNSDNVSQKFSKVGGHLNYHTRFSRNDSLTVNVRDDYFMYPASGVRGTDYTENSFNVSSSYGTIFFNAINAAFVLGVTDNRSQFSSGNVVSGSMSLDGSYRKLSLSLNAMTIYRLSQGATTRDSSVTMTVTRSF